MATTNHQTPFANLVRSKTTFRIVLDAAERKAAMSRASKHMESEVAKTDWITSEGGPLVCMEQHLQRSWGGVEKLTIEAEDATSDYDRACGETGYLASVQLQAGLALVIGDAPLDTAFWRSKTGLIFLVRIWFCESNFDVNSVMSAIDLQIFDKPAEVLRFSFATKDIVLFDSAEPGYETNKRLVPFSIKPGEYRISTIPYQPDSLTSLILHKFEPTHDAM